MAIRILIVDDHPLVRQGLIGLISTQSDFEVCGEASGLAEARQLAARSLSQASAAAKIVDGLEQALRHVRALSKGLVPVEVDSEGLMVALADLAARTSELHGVHCTFPCKEPVCILDNQTATHLYRLSQESVTNSLKHGRARKIVISLALDGDLITLKIADDGKGFSEEHHHAAGTGLRIMRYRAGLIRAKLTIGPAHPRGTQVTCTLPRQQDSWQANDSDASLAFSPKPETADSGPRGE